MKYRVTRRTILATLTMLWLGSLILPSPAYAAPSLMVSPSSGAPGTKVTITGTNFTSYGGDRLAVFFNDVEIATSPVSIPPTGVFQVFFQVPAEAAPGTATIHIEAPSGLSVAESQFYIPAPEIRLSTWGGTVGTAVSATCQGFFSEKPVTFYYYFNGSAEIIGTQTASGIGECSLQFIVPASPRGEHKITAANNEGHTASTGFSIIPSVTISAAEASAGDRVVITGTGFTASREVTVTLQDRRVAYSTAHARGTFNAIFIVPAIRAGTYLVGIHDQSGETKWGDLTVVARISLDKNSGSTGTRVTLTGYGFEARRFVVVKYDFQEIAGITADDTGAFSLSFNIPKSAAGVHFITATDSINTKQITFTVESDMPPVPRLLAPKQNSVVAAPVDFDWESVFDPSEPVVYTLQTARNDDFLRTLLVKEELSSSQYTMDGKTSLLPNRRGSYYYWRVRAIDAAGNAGEWSEPVAFRIKPTALPPAWFKSVLIAVQIALIAVLAILLYRGLAPRQPPAT